MDLRELQKRVFNIAFKKGWHEQPKNFGEYISNIHGEVSEAWEWYRIDNPKSDHIPKYSGIEEEFADAIIRILDAAEDLNLDVVGAIDAKCKYNETRSYRHGGKVA